MYNILSTNSQAKGMKNDQTSKESSANNNMNLLHEYRNPFISKKETKKKGISFTKLNKIKEERTKSPKKLKHSSLFHILFNKA